MKSLMFHLVGVRSKKGSIMPRVIAKDKREVSELKRIQKTCEGRKRDDDDDDDDDGDGDDAADGGGDGWWGGVGGGCCSGG